MKIQMKIDYKNEETKKRCDDSSVKVKFPKLIISQFDGTALDWFRFGNSSRVRLINRTLITHVERKNSRPDISILTVYEITPSTILKHVFLETTHEEVYICIIVLKVNA